MVNACIPQTKYYTYNITYYVCHDYCIYTHSALFVIVSYSNRHTRYLRGLVQSPCGKNNIIMTLGGGGRES